MRSPQGPDPQHWCPQGKRGGHSEEGPLPPGTLALDSQPPERVRQTSVV